MTTGYQGTKKNVVLFTKEGTGQLFWVDADGVERVVGPMPPPQPDNILAADSSVVSSGSWPSGDGNTDQLKLGHAFFATPRLRRNAVARWVGVGEYTNNTPNSTTINARLLIDGSAVGSTLQWVHSATAVASGGRIIFDAELYCNPMFPTPDYIIKATTTIITSTGTALLGTSQYLLPTINHLADQLIGWQIWKNPSGAGAIMNLHGMGCVQLIKTTGAY